VAKKITWAAYLREQSQRTFAWLEDDTPRAREASRTKRQTSRLARRYLAQRAASGNAPLGTPLGCGCFSTDDEL
jgi:hypothetical protein